MLSNHKNKIVIENLTVNYSDGTESLKDINLVIPAFAITVLFGPSGGGKSTILRTINRLNDLADVSTLKKKIRQVKNGLKRIANVTLHADIPRWAHLQGLFSRGDRRVADILLLANKNQGNWAKTLKESPLNPDFYTYRERPPDERLPWDFIDHGISKSFLQREYKKALQAKTSAPCRLVPCHECRVCMEAE